MHKKRFIPAALSILIFLAGGIILIQMYLEWTKHDFAVHNPAVEQITEESSEVNLKTIIHEAEKNVIQIESISGSNTTTGSGFLYNDKGDIVTNAHVIQDADLIYVKTANARIYPAAVVGIGEEMDIALLRVPQLGREYSLPIQKENFAEIGDEVIALGSPHGFQNTVTLGIISGTGREFFVDGYNYSNLYQISAPITHGNSGGPLIHRKTGEVIGINSVGTADGLIGFSIPISEVYEQIETWSNETANNELYFSNTAGIYQLQPELYVEDAKYIVEYFFNSIEIRDYVSAYALLGSSLQSETTYTDFRDQYIHIISLDYRTAEEKVREDKRIQINTELVLKKRNAKDKEMEEETVEIEFIIGYENDQLKILSMK